MPSRPRLRISPDGTKLHMAAFANERREAKLGLISMLYAIAVVLLILWLLGFLAFHIGGGLIHLLLVIAVVVIIYQVVTNRRVL